MLLSLRFLTKEFLLTFLLPGLNFDVTKSMFSLEVKFFIFIVLFQTAPLLIGQYTFNFNNFSIIYLFNGGGPFNPSVYGNLAGSSDILISYVYKLTMDNQQQAVGAAITIMISLVLMFFTFIGFKNSKAFKEEKL